MNIKKIIIAVGAIAILVVGGYQITMANFNQNGTLDTKMSAGKLGIELVDFDSTNSQNDIGKYQFSSALPGAVMTRQLGIVNSEDKDLYVRVTLTRYWTANDGAKVSDADPTYIDVLTKQADQWIITQDEGSNQERILFYYKIPISKQVKSTPFIDAIKLSEKIADQAYSKYHANIQIEAEAIQKVGATDAMLSQWGVEATFDEQGNISTIVE